VERGKNIGKGVIDLTKYCMLILNDCTRTRVLIFLSLSIDSNSNECVEFISQ